MIVSVLCHIYSETTPGTLQVKPPLQVCLLNKTFSATYHILPFLLCHLCEILPSSLPSFSIALSSAQFSCSVMSDSATPWTSAHQASLSITNSRSLLKLMSIELVMPSKTLILCHPHLLPPTIFYRIRSFSNELVLCIRWPKYWSFSFNISPSNEYLELISFRMNWLDLLVVQGTVKSLLQHHNSKT